MTMTDDPDKFQSRWEDHIKQLDRLKLAVPASELDRVDEAQENLQEIVELAAENVFDDEDTD